MKTVSVGVLALGNGDEGMNACWLSLWDKLPGISSHHTLAIDKPSHSLCACLCVCGYINLMLTAPRPSTCQPGIIFSFSSFSLLLIKLARC